MRVDQSVNHQHKLYLYDSWSGVQPDNYAAVKLGRLDTVERYFRWQLQRKRVTYNLECRVVDSIPMQQSESFLTSGIYMLGSATHFTMGNLVENFPYEETDLAYMNHRITLNTLQQDETKFKFFELRSSFDIECVSPRNKRCSTESCESTPIKRKRDCTPEETLRDSIATALQVSSLSPENFPTVIRPNTPGYSAYHVRSFKKII